MKQRERARPAAAGVLPWEAMPRKKATASPIVRVPLADGHREAVIHRRDFDRLRTAGVPLRWFTASGSSCVLCPHPAPAAGARHSLSVARLIMEAPPGTAVRHRDGDPLNLRMRNLFLSEDKRAKGRERDVMRRLRGRAA